MIRRARLSVKPNVRPGGGARGSSAPVPQRGQESPRPPEPAAPSAPKPAEPTDVPAVDSGGAEPPEKAPKSSDEKIGGGNGVEESSKSPSTVSQRRKRVSSTSSLAKPSVSVPSESPPIATAVQDAPQPNPVHAPQPNLVPTKEKQPCSDRYRIYKAQRLREMLKEELRKEKKQWKNKYALNESQRPLDRSKMTMRDFIYYLPDNNPMTSSLEQERKTEKLPPSVQTKEQENKNAPDAEGNEELEEETDDGPLLVPRVKVAEDGSIILDEESLTVEVLRTKGPCVVEENDPIFERGSTTTYSSFRKNYYSKPWSNKETDMFFLAISMVGTDFSMIGQLFPHRARIEIKNKFKREEKTNGWRIDKAFQEKRPFDFDFFAHLLQKVLAEEEKRKQKSVKNNSLKEKKASKPRKNVKVKKVASEAVIDEPEEEPEESMSTSVLDKEASQEDAQTVEEESSVSEQSSEQVALEQDLNKKKRRRKNQDETNKQEVKNLSGNVTDQSGSSRGEKRKSGCQSLRPALSEGECSEQQEVSCVQDVDGSVHSASGQKAERIIDPILPSSNHQDAVSGTTESTESSTSDLPSEVEVSATCELNNAESPCLEERNADLKSKSLDTEQTENVKPVLRGRLQRPKPNLSRAVGKKSVLSQGKADTENKNSLPETVEKNHMEKDKMKASDVLGMENTQKENSEAEPISNLNEKDCLQETNSPKSLKPARLMRGRLQRPKPNVGNVAERKILASQEKIGANAEENQTESCVDRDVSQQMEDQSCKNLEFEDTTSQPEKKDISLQSAQPDEPQALNECLSIQESNKANIRKQIPRTRFQKPKPNIGRGTGRREICSKEEVPEEILVSRELTAALGETISLDTLPRENVPVETTTTTELESDSKETGRNISPREKVSETGNVTVEMETYSKVAGREDSLMEGVSEVNDATKQIDTVLEETERREVPPLGSIPEEIKFAGETEAGLKEIEREMPPREMIPEMVDVIEEREDVLEGTEKREISSRVTASEQVRTICNVETELKGIEEVSQRENVPVEISATEEREDNVKETEKKDISLLEEVPRETAATEEAEENLAETVEGISLKESGSESIVIEESGADLEKTGKVDISPRESKPEETCRQTETDVMQSSSGDCSSTVPPPDIKNTSNETLSVLCTAPLEENRHSEKEESSPLNDLQASSQTAAEVSEKEDQRMQLPDAAECLSDTNLSLSLPQEQKPLEVKPAPFVRSRFKRPKPNLARAALKRETIEAGKCAPGKKSEADKMETVVVQQGSEQANTLPCQQAVASLMPSRGKEESDEKEKEDTVMLPCAQTEKDLLPSGSCEPEEKSQSAETQENDVALSSGTQNKNVFQQEMKESIIQTVQPIRGRLQRPRPNLRKAGQRKIEKSEAKSVIQEERAVLQNDEANEKSFTVQNSQIGTEIEVVSSKVSECRIHETQSHDVVLVENVDVNKINVLDEKMRHENKPYVPSPAQLITGKFQKAKPNLGTAHGKKEEPDIEKGTADQSEASKPEDNILQPGDSDTQLLLKEKAEFLTSLEVSPRKDGVGAEESGLAEKDAQLEEVGPSGNVEEETVGDKSQSPIVENQCISKPSYPQLLKESSYSKIASDQIPTISSASECKMGHNKRRMRRKIKPNVTKGRGSKRIRGRTSKKEPRASRATLVTLRASQEEEEDDAEDFESYFEEETYHLAPEEVNKAPVFVPVGLRSPEPVSAQIEETMEEEMTTSVHTQDEPGTNDGSAEAAIALLTMGDLVLQSEINTEQDEVGVCVLTDVDSKSESHIPFSPDNVNFKIVHECQELSSPVINTTPESFEENKIVLEEQSTREEIGLVEKVKENTTPASNTTSKVTSNLRMRRRFVKPKPNLGKVLRTSRLHVLEEVPSLCVTQEEKAEIPRETEENAPRATEVEDKGFGPVTAAENEEQGRLECIHGASETSISQEASLTQRDKEEEEGSETVLMPSAAPLVPPEPAACTLALGESSVDEPLRQESEGGSVLALHVPQCIPTSIPEVQQENVLNPQDLTVNVVADIHEEGEDEQAFILTLVEIPTNTAEEFTDATAQLMPAPLLPAPILVKSVNTEEKGDKSVNLPVTSFIKDDMYLSDFGRDDSKKPPANLDLISRKRFHCSLDEGDQVPPAKKSSLASGDDCQEYTSEVCSKELINVFEEAGKSYKGQDISPTIGSTLSPEPQKEHLESTLRSIGSGTLDNIGHTLGEKSVPQLPQVETTVSDREGRTDAASTSQQMESRAPATKPPLSRPGRRPLGFLSLICSKNSLESDEPTQVHRKKRLKPLIPVSRQNLKRSAPLNEGQKKNPETSDALPSPGVVANTQSENVGDSAAQDSRDQPLLTEECKSGQKQVPAEEPTSVSEYFFNDIFIEVDEIE
ncbi:transcription factor TFIIIB component B'' homolog isoform X2 [Lepus europaeus]|uniref:transcription factor TFIIIB component B'' homolog isoform X2 n=1 Tax=Lepus europaeus TaxID=9983 RepID=UPI002B499D78|nr:transcription factor TFIIIB component B'' homolog isoform X2 [Lepus europaeus]